MCPVAGPRAIRIGPSVFKPDIVQDMATKPGFSFYAFGITVCLSLSVHTCFSCIGCMYLQYNRKFLKEGSVCVSWDASPFSITVKHGTNLFRFDGI